MKWFSFIRGFMVMVSLHSTETLSHARLKQVQKNMQSGGGSQYFSDQQHHSNPDKILWQCAPSCTLYLVGLLSWDAGHSPELLAICIVIHTTKWAVAFRRVPGHVLLNTFAQGWTSDLRPWSSWLSLHVWSFLLSLKSFLRQSLYWALSMSTPTFGHS